MRSTALVRAIVVAVLSIPILFQAGVGVLARSPIREGDPAHSIVRKLQAYAGTIREVRAVADQAEEVAKTISDVNTLMRPVIPVLKKTSESRILQSLSGIAYVGGAAQAVRISAEALETLGIALVAVEEHDRRTAKRLRRAVFATDQFLRRQDTEDLPELVQSYDDAIPVVRSTIARNERVLTQIDTTDRALARVDGMKPTANKRYAELWRSVDDMRAALRQVRQSTLTLNRGLRLSLGLMLDVAQEGHAVLGR